MSIVSLLESLVGEIVSAEEKFYKNPKDFNSLEKHVRSSTEAFAARFLGEVLTNLDEQICRSSWRNGKYKVHRRETRNLISSVGDITFDCTYYKSTGEGKKFRHLIEDMIGLEHNERFTEEAEASMLCEALKTSYAEASEVLPSKQKITKTTVMNKVHGIAEEIPDLIYEEPKTVPYLYIEADEDHISEQHGRNDGRDGDGNFISKLVYIYERRQECPGIKGRYELVNTYYFAGLYPGADGNRRLWDKVYRFIEKNYDYGSLKRIFISGDGAGWIKSGARYLEKAVFCADKYHLMKYVNSAAGQMLDEKESAREELWHLLHAKKNARSGFDEYTQRMKASAKNPEKIDDLRTFVLGNWGAVRRTLKNRLVCGCSAEGHVSHVLSDRMSSRPMGWSQTGADRMSKLRCYERNNGREKIIDLVKYSRECRRMEATGTENISPCILSASKASAVHYDQAKSYIDRMQAHLALGTARKTMAIRTHLSSL